MSVSVQAYHGVLVWSSGDPYAVVQGLKYLVMYDPSCSGTFQLSGVSAAAVHYAALPNGAAVYITAGFVQDHDIDGSSNLKKALHILRF